MNTLIADVETDGLLDEMTKIWCLAISTEDGDAEIYADQKGYTPLRHGIKRLKECDRAVFHNGLGFDLWAINRVYPGTLTFDQIYDTLVASRLWNPKSRAHALEDWGVKLGVPKQEHDEWDRFSDAMAERCLQDVRINVKVYHGLRKKLRSWGDSVRLEHQARLPIALQEQNGFPINIKAAEELASDLRQELVDIEDELREVFPPMWVAKKAKGTTVLFPGIDDLSSTTFTPKVGKPTGKSQYVKGAPFTKVEYRDFNPSSRPQIEKRLRLRGWKPRVFNESGSAKVDEQVLADVAVIYPDAKPLLRYLTVQKQLGQIADGEQAWLKLYKGGRVPRVHGAVNTNGAQTGRMSHFKPNLAQVNKKELRMREVWIASPGYKLVGSDADGLELRILGHYLSFWDGGEFIRKLTEGSKHDGTDAHSANQKLIGLNKRDNAKTVIYALIYGAGDKKLGLIVIEDAIEHDKYNPEDSPHLFKTLKSGKKSKRSPSDIGREARSNLEKGITGLEDLVSMVKKRHNRKGYIIGLDGRRVFTVSEHSALNFLVQGGGAIVMKKALALFHFEEAVDLGIVSSDFLSTKDFGYCANVHDEVQMEVDPAVVSPEEVGKTFGRCIERAGKELDIQCPLLGDEDVGDTWRETH